MGNSVSWQDHELAYLAARDWEVFRQRLFTTDLELTQLLKVFREIDSRERGCVTRIEFYLHFKYPFITPMADKLFDAFTGFASDGKMRFREFATSVLTMSMSQSETLINFLFDMYDADGNRSMDQQELVDCLEDIFGPPEQAEWFSILNECTRSLVNKYTKMGEVALTRKRFREMVMSNEPLMTYLPIFVLQRDMIDKTLGRNTFEQKPIITRMPHNFVEKTFEMTHGERGREELQAKMIAELKQSEETWRKEKMGRTKDGLRQLLTESHSHISFSKERPPKCVSRKPRIVHVRSKEKFTLQKHKKIKKILTPEEKAQVQLEKSAQAHRAWKSQGGSTKRFSPKMAMVRSRYRSDRKELPFYIPARGEE